MRARRAAVRGSGKPPDAAMALISVVIPGHRSSNQANRSACSSCPFAAVSPVGVSRSACWSARGCRPVAWVRGRAGGRGRVSATRCGAPRGGRGCGSLRSSGSAGRCRSAVAWLGRVGVVALLPAASPAGSVRAGDGLIGAVGYAGLSVQSVRLRSSCGPYVCRRARETRTDWTGIGHALSPVRGHWLGVLVEWWMARQFPRRRVGAARPCSARSRSWS
jgi:hypothetical protein